MLNCTDQSVALLKPYHDKEVLQMQTMVIIIFPRLWAFYTYQVCVSSILLEGDNPQNVKVLLSLSVSLFGQVAVLSLPTLQSHLLYVTSFDAASQAFPVS